MKHFLSVLYHDIGLNVLNDKVSKPFKGIKIATHYGCHALRPSDITEFDNPVAPVLFDYLVSATGAQSVDWPLKLECCGSPLLGVNDDLSLDLAEKKLADAKRSGADYLCVACPYCQMQFDRVQEIMLQRGRLTSKLPSIVYPQLLGLCLGIDPKHLGLDKNRLSPENLETHLVPWCPAQVSLVNSASK